MNTGDKIAASERAVERAIVIDRVLEIIDEVSPTERRTFDVQEIRDRVLALKGW